MDYVNIHPASYLNASSLFSIYGAGLVQLSIFRSHFIDFEVHMRWVWFCKVKLFIE